MKNIYKILGLSIVFGTMLLAGCGKDKDSNGNSDDNATGAFTVMKDGSIFIDSPQDSVAGFICNDTAYLYACSGSAYIDDSLGTLNIKFPCYVATFYVGEGWNDPIVADCYIMDTRWTAVDSSRRFMPAWKITEERNGYSASITKFDASGKRISAKINCNMYDYYRFMTTQMEYIGAERHQYNTTINNIRLKETDHHFPIVVRR